jgi:hypothetical protein
MVRGRSLFGLHVLNIPRYYPEGGDVRVEGGANAMPGTGLHHDGHDGPSKRLMQYVSTGLA